MAFAFSKTTPADNTAAMFSLKTLLKAQGWTVPSSGDSLTYFSASDGLTTSAGGAGGLGNTNAWFRIQDPAGLQEFTFQRSSTSTPWRIKFSLTSKFVTGTPTATRTPAAADEYLLWGAGTDAAPQFATLFAADGSTRWNVAADSSAPYGWWSGAFTSGGGATQTALVYDPLTPSDVTDTMPWLLYVTSLPAGSTPFQLASISAEAMSNTVNVAASNSPSATVGTPQFYQALSLASTSGTCVPNAMGGNPISGKDEVFPLVWARRAPQASPGFKGLGTLMKWNGTTRSNGDTLSVVTTRDRIVYKDLNLPWDGSVPIV